MMDWVIQILDKFGVWTLALAISWVIIYQMYRRMSKEISDLRAMILDKDEIINMLMEKRMEDFDKAISLAQKAKKILKNNGF